MAGGTYLLPATLQLGPADSNLRIVSASDAALATGASAAPGDAAPCCGGALLPADLRWEPAATAGPDARLFAHGASGMLVATLPATATDANGSMLPADFDTLFVRGRRATRARFPNANAETQGFLQLAFSKELLC